MASERRRRAETLARFMAADARRLRILLASNVRFLRGARGWTQEELADRAGVDPAQIQRVENARTNFTSLTLAALVRGLGCQPVELFIPRDPPEELGRPGRPPRR